MALPPSDERLLKVDLYEGLAFSCILAVLCAVLISRGSLESYEEGIVYWLGFVVASGLGITVRRGASLIALLKFGVLPSVTLFLTLNFLTVISISFPIKQEFIEAAGVQFVVVEPRFGSVPGQRKLVPKDEASREAMRQAEKEHGIAVSSYWAIVGEGLLLSSVIALFTSVGIAVSTFARRRVQSLIKGLLGLSPDVVGRLEKVINTLIRLATVVVGIVASL